MPLFLFLFPLQHVKRSALQNKQVVSLRMAFRARKVLGTFDKRAPDLVEVLNFCYLSGSLSRTQRRGLIALSFKKGDRLDPRNWRPISLLNVDYKIASRAIAGRLLKVIHLVVNSNQTCGVPGRYILVILWLFFVMLFLMPPCMVPR